MTLKSVGQIGKEQTIQDNEDDFVPPLDMLRELMNDHKKIVKFMRDAHGICDEHEDIATASLIENWIDEAEKRLWFLFEASRSWDRDSR
jgi:starvation-inducible DNA-binding protein